MTRLPGRMGAALLILLLGGGWTLFASEHQEPSSPEAQDRRPQASIPVGPPQEVEVRPGTDLQGVQDRLPVGSIMDLLPGIHTGPLVVDRPLTVRGREGAVVDGEGKGTVVEVRASDVTLQELTLRGGGERVTRGDSGLRVEGDRFLLEHLILKGVLVGMDLRNAHSGTVRGCLIEGRADRTLGQRGDGIRLWESDDNLIEGNRLMGVRDLVVWYSERNRIFSNHVENSRYGTHFMHADDNQVRGNTYLNNVVGVFVMYSRGISLEENLLQGARGAAGMGLGFKESDDILARGNRILLNNIGIYLDMTPHDLGGHALFQGNLVGMNGTGLRLHGSQAGAEFTDNDFHENEAQVEVDGRSNALGTVFLGNRYSDHAGYDLDGDGIGDLPYEVRRLSGSLKEGHPDLAFFAGTPAVALLDLLGAAFPMFTPSPVMRDPSPRMEKGNWR